MPVLLFFCALTLNSYESLPPILESGDFYRPVALKIDRQGRFFVVDQGDHRVWVFAPDGKSLFSFGGQGQGPGELQNPCDLDFLADGRVLVSDSGNRRILVFDATGQFENIIKIPDQTVGQILALPNGEFLLTKVGGYAISFSIDDKEQKRFSRYNLEGQHLEDFGTHTPHENPLLSVWLNRGAIDLMGDRVVYAGTVVNEIVVYGDHENRSRYSLKFVPREPKADMKETKTSDGKTNFQMMVLMDQLIAAMAVRTENELVLMRATGSSAEEAPAFELVRIDFQGELLQAYPGTYESPSLDLGVDGNTVYILHERDEDWALTPVVL